MTGQPGIAAAIDRVISALASLAEALEQDNSVPAGFTARHDLAAAQESFPYGGYGHTPECLAVINTSSSQCICSSAKHGRYDAASAAAVAEGAGKCPECARDIPAEEHQIGCPMAEGVEPCCTCELRLQLALVNLPAAEINALAPPCRHHPAGHLPQHKGGCEECTSDGCCQPGHHLHAASIPGDVA